MPAAIVDAASSSSPPPGPSPESAPPTVDFDPTTDLQDESTSDLAPATVDLDEPAANAGSVVVDSKGDDGTPEPHDDTARSLVPPPGAVLADRYEIEAAIGGGGVAMVFRARDLRSSSDARVALKLARPELHDQERARARLTHEHRAAAGLAHPNIVRVFDLHAEAEPCFMTMELIEGRLLSSMMRDSKAPPPAGFAHRVLQGCASALAHAHGRSVVHGDFKPGNVFVTRDQQVKLIDFGAAAALGDESRIAAGTPAYASPEVLSGETPEPRDDVFSFACVAYELLTGRHPFDRRSSLQARDEGCLPPRAWALSASQWLTLLSGLSWSRDQRPRDIESLANALAPQAQNSITQPAASVAATARLATGRELADDLAPPQRSWGFFVFLACALAVTFIATQRQSEQAVAEKPAEAAPLQISEAPLAPAGLMGAPAPEKARAGAPLSSLPRERSEPGSTPAAPASGSAAVEAPASKPASRASAAPLSEITFESDGVVTSEGSVAAVFLIHRSQPLSGRSRVRWSAASGSAEAGVDFASVGPEWVEFADGQAQRAIYVPLRDDLLKEDDETFTLRLHAPQGARLGKSASVTATIRDDD